MSLNVIVGRGGVATATALLLAEAGERVRMVSRGGLGPTHPNVELIALDATDTAALTDLARGARTVFNCAMPAYHTWPETLPPLFDSIRAATEAAGADLVLLGNHYAYGPVEGVVDETAPLAATGAKGRVRAQVWTDALDAHRAGRVRVTEVRAGQFVGVGAVSLFSLLVQPAVLAGEPASVPQGLDLAHAFTVVDDAARALVTVAGDDRAWGRAWHAPVVTTTIRTLATRLAELADAPAPVLTEMTDDEILELGRDDPFWPELLETAHMSRRDFLVDDTAVRTTFGLTATGIDDVLAGVVRAARVPAETP
ncbi:NAD-dependent epimerase/dehydratase family protein [Nocardia sp. NPDC050413]|uniref:NAD-dependent epimerase/dehydratase family protein n=1 Tax=Nocardia sp. NPDC050413 TaxID=3155784 RepID=UPI0033F4E6D8